jgi:hypothetical protein
VSTSGPKGGGESDHCYPLSLGLVYEVHACSSPHSPPRGAQGGEHGSLGEWMGVSIMGNWSHSWSTQYLDGEFRERIMPFGEYIDMHYGRLLLSNDIREVQR